MVQLLQGADPLKDQSYFLAAVRPEALEHFLFPLGELAVDQVHPFPVVIHDHDQPRACLPTLYD